MNIQTIRPVALVTGTSSGIGAVYADRLAARGYDLIVVARRADRLETLAIKLKAAHGATVRAVTADLSTEPGIAAVEALLASDPQITMLVNNAGLARVGPFASLPDADHHSILMVNALAPSRLARAILPGFIARNTGTIINIGSVNSVYPYPSTAAYSATKAFILSLSLALQEELKETGVRVQAVLPAATVSEIWDGSGFELVDVPPEVVMTTEAMVDAALAGLDTGERVTMPSVADPQAWDRNEAAARALFVATQTGTPASRYRAA